MTPKEISVAITDAAKGLLDAAVSEKDPIIQSYLAQRAAWVYEAKVTFLYAFLEAMPDDIRDVLIDTDNYARAVAISKRQPKGDN